jgi:hypothetical protein
VSRPLPKIQFDLSTVFTLHPEMICSRFTTGAQLISSRFLGNSDARNNINFWFLDFFPAEISDLVLIFHSFDLLFHKRSLEWFSASAMKKSTRTQCEYWFEMPIILTNLPQLSNICDPDNEIHMACENQHVWSCFFLFLGLHVLHHIRYLIFINDRFSSNHG